MPCVGTHSGLGLMLAMEIVADKETKAMFDPPLAPIMPAAGRGPAPRTAPAADGVEPHRHRAAVHDDDRRGGRDRRHPQAAGGRHRAAPVSVPGEQAKKRVQDGASRGEWHVPGGDHEQTQDRMDRPCRGAGGADGGRRADGVRKRVDRPTRRPARRRRGQDAHHRRPHAVLRRRRAVGQDGARQHRGGVRAYQRGRGIKAGNDTYTLRDQGVRQPVGSRPSRRPSRARPWRTASATSCRGRARGPGRERRRAGDDRPHVRHRFRTRCARAPSTRTTTTTGSTSPTT